MLDHHFTRLLLSPLRLASATGRWLLPLTLSLASLVSPALQAAQQQWLDTTVAIVENDVILASQINRRIDQVAANLRAKGFTLYSLSFLSTI